jgi:hypothetical protein
MTSVRSTEARRAIPSGFLWFAVWLFVAHADPIASSDIYVIDGDTIGVRGRRNLAVRPSATAPAKRTAGRGGICFR